MKTILTILITIILLSTSISIYALPQEPQPSITKTIQIKESICFSPPTYTVDTSEYTNILLKNTPYYIRDPGKPNLPKKTIQYLLPFGITDINVTITVNQIHEIPIPKPIRLAETPKIIGHPIKELISSSKKNDAYYTNHAPYPNTWYSYNTGCGLDKNRKHVTYLTITIYPIRYQPQTQTILYTTKTDITVSYKNNPLKLFPTSTQYELVIIAPQRFSFALDKLVNHKKSNNIPTLLKTTEDIYTEYTGVDKPEKIKCFIKEAMETYNISQVLLIGGLKSIIYAPPKDDRNQGSRGWYVPVRYSNHYDNDHGFLCDLYYADIYKTGGLFDDWDSNNDGIIGARNLPGYEDDELDLYPDVSVGRLPCRNIFEVKTIINKIITYESKIADPTWFNNIVAIAGDGLQDQTDLNIEWNTTTIPNGNYTIYAQSRSHITGKWGILDNITIMVNHDTASNISFSEDDHLRISTYPGPAIAEITSPSQGNVLGNTDIDFLPNQAYMGDGWARVEYLNGTMHIRGKSYDPQPYGFYTDIKIWIKNQIGSTIFTKQRNTTRVYFDCEWTSGNRPLGGNRSGAFYYMPEHFNKNLLWASSGNFTSQQDTINTLSKGCGFAFFFGHASPNVMVVNLPGMPGGFSRSAIPGLQQFSLAPPYFPMNKIKNTNKLPIVAVMGCHNSQYNLTLISSLLDRNNAKKTWVYGAPTIECWSWWLTRLPKRGAIATIGCTALGPGEFNNQFVPDTGCWIFPEFFRQYGEQGHTILGDVFDQTLTAYINTFGQTNFIDAKMVQELALMGDPSLRIGGIT